MNGSTEIEAGPSRSHSHSGYTARRSSSSQPHPPSQSQSQQTQSRSQSHSQHRRQSSSHDHTPSSRIEETSSPKKPKPQQHHLDIATYPTQHLLRLLAGLLQQIATSNDALRSDHDPDLESEDQDENGDATETLKEEGYVDESTRSRSRTHSRTPSTSLSISHQHLSFTSSSSPTSELFDQNKTSSSSSSDPTNPTGSSSSSTKVLGAVNDQNEFPLFTASKSSLSHPSSLLAFHARHIPSISIESYLLRILKYCPTTNEVFLGLLVYFDRMTRLGTPLGVGGTNAIFGGKNGSGGGKDKKFAIDSYNVHRLVIAGVTVASKFFSDPPDVFYTNSRYAKVGGLPPTELNSLELQFLLLNDFRLRISLEEMQKYGDRLLSYSIEEEEKLKKETEIERERMEKSRIVDTPHAGGPSTGNERADSASASGEESKSHTTTAEQSDEGQSNHWSTNTDPTPNKPNEQTQIQPPQPPSTNPVNSNTIRGKDKDVRFNTNVESTVTSTTTTNAGNQAQISASGPGIRDWVRGEEVMGRMASPMRD